MTNEEGAEPFRTRFTRLRRIYRVIRGTFKYTAVGLLLILIASFFLSHILGLYIFLFTTGGLDVARNYIDGISIFIFPFPVMIPIKINIGGLFSILWIFQLLCLLMTTRPRSGVLTSIKESLKGPTGNILKSTPLSVPLLANALFTGVMALLIFQESQGVPTGSPPAIDVYEFYFYLTYAAVFEEIAFRVLTVGLFEAILTWRIASLMRLVKSRFEGTKIFFKAMAFPHKTKEDLGIISKGSSSTLKFDRSEWFILAWSSLTFGLAHLLSGYGWEIGKISQASIIGLAAGMLYIKFGFPASMIIHWYFNNYFEAYRLASGLNPLLNIFSNFNDLLNTIVGVSFWIVIIPVVTYKLLRSIKRR